MVAPNFCVCNEPSFDLSRSLERLGAAPVRSNGSEQGSFLSKLMLCIKKTNTVWQVDKTATGLVASTHHLPLATVSHFASFVADNNESGVYAVLKAISLASDFEVRVSFRFFSSN